MAALLHPTSDKETLALFLGPTLPHLLGPITRLLLCLYSRYPPLYKSIKYFFLKKKGLFAMKQALK